VTDDEPKDAVLEALWKRVLDAWDDEKTHAALIEHAMRAQRLPETAGRYRALIDDPDKARSRRGSSTPSSSRRRRCSWR